MIPENKLTEEAENENSKPKKIEKTIYRENLVYITNMHLAFKIFEQ